MGLDPFDPAGPADPFDPAGPADPFDPGPPGGVDDLADLPRARGRALERTEADLDRLSRVTEADMDEAAADWRRRVPLPYRGLVDAVAEDADDPTPAEPAGG